jgi:transcriptional regulator with XRE-family HTH domain
MSGLRTIRRRQKLSQRELAEATGLTAASISRYETGGRKMSVDVAKRLSKALNTNWISFFDEQMTTKDAQGG